MKIVKSQTIRKTNNYNMTKKKSIRLQRSNEEIKKLLLQYFYDRNNNATSARGKKGSAVKISDVKKETKVAHDLTPQEVQRNLTYLLSEKWVEEVTVEKSFKTQSGTLHPSVTSYYQITSAGIDKIEGAGEFTMDKFHGIKIEATGQNIITLGDGNKIDANFSDLGNALAELRNAITSSSATEQDKLNYVADIETIQSQLAKPTPNKSIIKAAWLAIQNVAVLNGCITFFEKVSKHITDFIS
jgi:hypothetical protein